MIVLDTRVLFQPGSSVRFKCAPDLVVTVTAVHIYGNGNVNYTVSWIHDGNVKEETVNELMVEDPTPPPLPSKEPR